MLIPFGRGVEAAPKGNLALRTHCRSLIMSSYVFIHQGGSAGGRLVVGDQASGHAAGMERGIGR